MEKIAFSLITVTTLLALAACGSANNASTSKTSTSSAKTSISSSASSSKSSSSSQKKTTSSSQETASNASSAVASSSSTTQPASDSVPATDAGQAAAATPAASPAPATSLVAGTWSGATAQAKSIKMTIDANGNITVVANYGDDNSDIVRQSTAHGTAVEVAPGFYRWDQSSGDDEALLAGVTGLGWDGATQVAEGFLLQGNQYTPVLFRGPAGQPLDYTDPNNYHAFTNAVLTKE